MKIVYNNYRDMDRGNCSTVIIGKDASVTGNVIMGHNEDDDKCVVQTHIVPARRYGKDDFITFEDGSAVIPQVPRTYGYYWSEVRCEGGISFADCFVNEKGVAIVSNSCRPSKDPQDKEGDNKDVGGMGYALRRLIAERAGTAREGVEVAARLVEKYGYFSGRTYHIADKNEAWSFQVVKGHNFAARRIGDDEIYYLPNWYTIHKIDFSDTEHKNFYWSENLVKLAIDKGWYKPATEDYSDFDFAVVYQYGEMMQYNIFRARNAWRILTGKTLKSSELKPFSMKATKKYSSSDVKKVLRSHYEGTEDDFSENYTRNPHRIDPGPMTICNCNTVESTVIEFNQNEKLLRMMRAFPKPCLCPYTPWYPVAMTRVPEEYEWIDVAASQRSHFDVDGNELRYNPAKAWWILKNLQYMTEFNYKFTIGPIRRGIDELEADWESEKAGIEKGYLVIAQNSESAAREYLTDISCARSRKTLDWALKTTGELGEAMYYKNMADWGDVR